MDSINNYRDIIVEAGVRYLTRLREMYEETPESVASFGCTFSAVNEDGVSAERMDTIILRNEPELYEELHAVLLKYAKVISRTEEKM